MPYFSLKPDRYARPMGFTGKIFHIVLGLSEKIASSIPITR